MKLFRLILWLCFANCLNSEAQVFNFANYSINDGLGASKVNAMLQDKQGYIWFATTMGLSKFDSHNFTNYSVNQGLSNNKVTAIIELKTGEILCGHDDGTLTLIKDGKFVNILLDSLNSRIFSISYSASGALWFATERNGAFLVESNNLFKQIKEQKFQHYNEKNKLARSVYQVVIDHLNNEFFVTDLGIKIRTPKNNDFQYFYPKGVDIPQFTSFIEDNEYNYWFGTLNQGVFKFNPKTLAIKQYNIENSNLNNNFISTIYKTPKGEIIIGTWGGGFSLIKNNELVSADESNGLCENKVNCLLQDNEGNIWIGSNQNGVSCYRGQDFKGYLLSRDGKNNQVGAIYESADGTTWIGSNNGIYTISKGKNALDEKSISLSLFDEPVEITSITEDARGLIWISTLGRGIILINPKTKEKALLSDYLESISSDNSIQQRYFTEKYINVLFTDSRKRIWIGMISGVSVFDPQNNSIRTFTEKDGLPENNVIDLLEDKDKNIWMATGRKGIAVFDGIKFSLKKNEQNPIYPSISSLAKDNKNNIWISTEGGGFYLFDGKNFKQFSEKEGLPTSFITTIQPDLAGNVWLGTNKGLIKYEIKNKSFSIFDRFNRNNRIEIKPNASFINANGALWFGTINGVFTFDSDFDNNNTFETKTQLYSVKLFDKDSIANGKSLNYKQNYLTFQFNGICYSDPDKVLYQYRLAGLHQDWQQPTAVNFVTFANIKPGDYEFELKAANNSGIWNKENIRFKFSISPPFYNTWWFYLLCLLGAFIFVIAYIKVRERNLIQEKAKLEVEVKKRTEEINDQKNEIEKQRDELKFTSNIISQNNVAIKDSIRYAKRIQLATLPKNSEIYHAFPKSFLLYKPKDIVSGDFYSLAQKEDKLLIAVADCTGHGVPGAFMSMIGTNLINQIINEKNITKPGEILNELDYGIENSLKQQETDSHDGMDIALLSYFRDSQQFEYAGANRPLYIWRKNNQTINGFSIENGIVIIKPDKDPIGGFTKEVKRLFTTHQFSLESGDRIFMFTDGYADQFGGELGKKMLIKRLKEAILISNKLTIQAQGSYLERFFNEWKGKNEQVDDVLMFGLEI